MLIVLGTVACKKEETPAPVDRHNMKDYISHSGKYVLYDGTNNNTIYTFTTNDTLTLSIYKTDDNGVMIEDQYNIKGKLTDAQTNSSITRAYYSPTYTNNIYVYNEITMTDVGLFKNRSFYLFNDAYYYRYDYNGTSRSIKLRKI